LLILSRKDAERILIRPGDGLDPRTTVADLFRDGPIEITIFSRGDVKMGVHAPRQLSIWRKGPAAS
jgi:sRNA-binding carbon storage regulator CsrA